MKKMTLRRAISSLGKDEEIRGTRLQRALASASRDESIAWQALKAHRPEDCRACAYAASLQGRCGAHDKLYAEWCEAKKATERVIRAMDSGGGA
jgi:hypothetical protein